MREKFKKAKKVIYTDITYFIRDPVTHVVATGYLTLSISCIKGAAAFLERFYQLSRKLLLLPLGSHSSTKSDG